MKHLIAILFVVILNQVALATAASTGVGGGTLASLIDSKINAAMTVNNVPGMTVAVTQNGRLVYSKGFGFARADAAKIQMKQNMRTRIGSVSKVVVTSPSGFQILKEKGINPKTKKLYGSSGVFGNKFKQDISIGSARFTPFAGMAINKHDKTYTWYINGKVSIGTTSDLDAHRAPESFRLPPSRRLTDIRDIAISDNDRVYTWYNDRTFSIGSSRDLGSIDNVVLNNEGKPLKVRMPSGKSMLDVTGIAIAKKGEDTDHVYVWYEDGTLSSGTPTDFTSHFVNRSYKVSKGSRYTIRAMAISSNDHVFAWLSNGKAQSGTSRELGEFRSPYSYTMAPQGRLDGPDDRRRWAHDITIQHLLDHEAGFQRNGATEDAMVMFNKSNDTISYEQVHRHFLRSRPLRWPPGEAEQYSNHGFGIWTLIVKALSGETYKDYAINNFLTPIGLSGAVRPYTIALDGLDSHPHTGQEGDYSVEKIKENRLGLAAGGWTASASSLLKITKHLNTEYSQAQLRDMGWSSNNKGKLAHNGRTKGGTAYVAMYPQGYLEGGQDIGGIHVALAANISTSTNAMIDLATEIAKEVPKSGIGSHFDLWQAFSFNND